ncbi:MAG: isoprenyl transferase [Candidatus Omnitrophota bacterium]|nr:MAG: isoprenyl transferase [Candidatus Omnitrophota bacterium]
MLKSSQNPRHIAIIMDGNGRWARKRGLPRTEGHKEGIKTVERIIEAGIEQGIEILTLYAFSLENWKRPSTEVRALMQLLREFLIEKREFLKKERVKLISIGERKRLPMSLQRELEKTEELTKDNKGLILNIALSYGSRREIVNAVKKIAQEVKEGRLNIERISERTFSHYLYTKTLPDPDLLIRTSGELRISNFLLYQISYTELYFTPKLWPDFQKEDLLEAIANFKKRKRRFGGLSEEDS